MRLDHIGIDLDVAVVEESGERRPLLAVVQKSTDAEQKRGKHIGFLAEIEEPDSAENAYHDHGYNFEHGVRSARFSGSQAERLAKGLSSQRRVGPYDRENAEQDGNPAKYKHYLIPMRVQETAMLMLNGH
jgi:hypothetical protein